MTRTLALTGILMMATVLVVPSAFARGRGHGHGGERGDRDFSCRGIEQLDLDDEQAETIDALKDSYQQQAEPLRDAVAVQRDELRALWQADQPDREAILAKMDEMEANKDALRVMKVDFKLDMLSVLTPEQRTELDELRSERRERRSERREYREGKRGERGDCGDCQRRRARRSWDDE